MRSLAPLGGRPATRSTAPRPRATRSSRSARTPAGTSTWSRSTGGSVERIQDGAPGRCVLKAAPPPLPARAAAGRRQRTAAAPDRTAPRVSIRVARKGRVGRRAQPRILLTAIEACRVTIGGAAGRHAASARAHGRCRRRPPHDVRLRAEASAVKRINRALRRHAARDAARAVTAVDAAGNVGRVTRRLTSPRLASRARRPARGRRRRGRHSSSSSPTIAGSGGASGSLGPPGIGSPLYSSGSSTSSPSIVTEPSSWWRSEDGPSLRSRPRRSPTAVGPAVGEVLRLAARPVLELLGRVALLELGHDSLLASSTSSSSVARRLGGGGVLLRLLLFARSCAGHTPAPERETAGSVAEPPSPRIRSRALRSPSRTCSQPTRRTGSLTCV